MAKERQRLDVGPLDTYLHAYIYCILFIYIYTISLPFEGGDVPKLQDTIWTFLREGGLVNVGKHLFFYLRYICKISCEYVPSFFTGFHLFSQKTQGGRSKCKIAFLKNARK